MFGVAPKPNLSPIGGNFFVTKEPQPPTPPPGGFFSRKPLAIEARIIRDECNIGIDFTPVLAFVRLPSQQIVYRNPECSVSPPKIYQRIPEDYKKYVFTCDNGEYWTVCNSFDEAVQNFYAPDDEQVLPTIYPAGTDFAVLIAHYTREREKYINWYVPFSAQDGNPVEEIYLGETTVYDPRKFAVAKYSREGGLLEIDRSIPVITTGGSLYSRSANGTINSLSLYNFGFFAFDFAPPACNPSSYRETPPPPPACNPSSYRETPPPPKKECCPMACCPPQDNSNLEALLRLLLKRVGVPQQVTIFDEDLDRKGAQKANKTPQSLNEYLKLAVERVEIANRIMGIENFPVTVPDTMIDPHKDGVFAKVFGFIDGNKKRKITTITEFIAWMSEQDSAVLGEFHQVIETEIDEKDAKGKPKRATIVLPNVAESLKEIVLLTAQMAKQNNIQTELIFKIAAETVATRAVATKGTAISQDIQDYLDYPTKTKTGKFPTTVSLPKLSTNKDGIPIATGSTENPKNFLKPGEVQYTFDDWTGDNREKCNTLSMIGQVITHYTTSC